MYDVVVIGAGPAGMAAGMYAAAEKLKTLVVTKELSAGKPGSFDIVDHDLIKQKFSRMAEENKKYLQLRNGTEILNLEKNVVSFSLETKSGEIIYGKSVIIATGNSELLFDLLTYKGGTGKIKVDARMQTNVPGIFAAGEVNDAGKKNILAAAGEGAKAALSALEYIKAA